MSELSDVKRLPPGSQLGEPIERDGVTVIPVFGRRGSVRGAYVISAGKGRWEPAFSLNQAILVGNLTCWLGLLFGWWYLRRRSTDCDSAGKR